MPDAECQGFIPETDWYVSWALSWCLGYLMFENVQNIQLCDSRKSPGLLEKAFLPVVIYFGWKQDFS